MNPAFLLDDGELLGLFPGMETIFYEEAVRRDGEKTRITTEVMTIDTSGPRDQKCPLNGAYFTKGEREVWEKRRPLAVMIENHADSRPQSGLSRADVVYEAVAEGGISRFLAVFYCGAAAGSAKPYDVGPVRSARTYFLDWASEYADYPLYLHAYRDWETI